MRPSSHRPEINDVSQLRTATAVVVLVDAHSAVIARCADGVLTRVRSVSAPRPHGASDHMGDWPRNSFHPGTRGKRRQTPHSGHAHRHAGSSSIAWLRS